MRTLGLALFTLGMMAIATYQEMHDLNPEFIYIGIAIAFFAAIYPDDEKHECQCTCQCQDD